jgi:hypothetical protein
VEEPIGGSAGSMIGPLDWRGPVWTSKYRNGGERGERGWEGASLGSK